MYAIIRSENICMWNAIINLYIKWKVMIFHSVCFSWLKWHVLLERKREREGKLNAIWIGIKNSFHSFCYKFKLIGSLSWQKVEQVSITKEKLYIHNQRNVSHLSAIYYTLRVYKMTWKIGITLMYLIKQWWSNLEPMAWIELEARIIYINIILL